MSGFEKARHFPLLSALLISGFMCFYNLGYGSFGAGDQTIHARVVSETIESGDYLRPLYKGRLYNNKPPFKLWLTMQSVKLLGPSNLAFRIWDGISGFATMMLLYYYGSRIYRSRAAGFVAVLALCGAMVFFYGHGCQNGVQDSMMLTLMTLATFSGWEFVQESKKHLPSNQRLWLLSVIGGLSTGLGFLTKNVPAFYSLVVLGLFVLVSGDALRILRKHWGKVLLILVLSIMPMALYLWARGEDRAMTIHMLFNIEIIKRATNGFNFKREKFFYFNILFLNGELVAPLAVAWGALVAIYQIIMQRSQAAMFALIWAAVPLLIQSASKAKAEWYSMPALPGLALLAAGGVWFLVLEVQKRYQAYLDDRNGRVLRSLVLTSILAAGIVISLPVAAARVAVYTITKHVKNDAEIITSSLRSHQRRLGRPIRIVAFDMPRLADHEILYWRLISGDPIVLSQDHLKQQLLSETPPDIVLTGVSSESSIWDIRKPTSSVVFSPRDKRRHRLVVLSYFEGFTPNLMHAARLPFKSNK
jgi:4-amino-4-deoxy-L-arabinose transferase-like glycosyltransferase